MLTAAALTAAALHLAFLDAGLAFRLATKAVPVLCLMLWVRSLPSSLYSRAIHMGLVFSLIGDELLELDFAFVAGLSAFLCAHLCYAGAFWSRSGRPALLRALPFVAAFGAVYVALWPGLGRLAVPVAVYVLALTLALWRASAAIGASTAGRAAEWLALTGIALFAASDGLIGWTRFQATFAGAGHAIMVLYWAGQTLIALSIGTQGPLLPAQAESAQAEPARAER